MNNVEKQVLQVSSRAISAANLEAVISKALEAGEHEDLKGIFVLEFDPLEAGYAS